jgi:ribosome-binding protein aMBF1 (putative translation factor)
MLRIEFERRQRGWSQRDLAHVSRVSQQEISLIERGRLIPTDEQASRLARTLQVRGGDLLATVRSADIAVPA